MWNFKSYLQEIKSTQLITAINIFGYSIGLSACILIGIYTYHQLSYDTFNKESNRIFRLDYFQNKKNTYNATTNHQWAEVLLDELPEVEKIARFDWPYKQKIKAGENTFEIVGCMGDAELFQIFSFPLVYGDKENIFSSSNAIAISESSALKLFGKTNVLGERVFLNTDQEYHVTAVFENIPKNSTLKFDYLTNPKEEINRWDEGTKNHWLMWRWRTFILLRDESMVEAFENKMPTLQKKYINDWHARTFDYYLHPLTKVHLHSSNIQGGFDSDISKSTLYIFASIGFLILLIACFNFINLSTTSFEDRKKSIQIKKLIGASKKSLFYQYLTYSILLTFACLIIGILISKLLLPFIHSLTGEDLILPFSNPLFFVLLFVFGLFMGSTAGIYPALYVSKQISIEKYNNSVKVSGLRNYLVIFQFIIVIGLLSFIGLVKKQLDYGTKGDLGYNYSAVISFWNSEKTFEHYDSFHDEMVKIPGVYSTTSCNFPLPGHFGNFWGVRPKGVENSHEIFHVQVAPNFFEVMKIPVIKQHAPFKPDTSANNNNCIINMEAYKMFSISDKILGNTFKIGNIENTVVGVSDNFHNHDLHNTIKPVTFGIRESCWNNLIRIDKLRVGKILKDLEKVWKQFEDKYPFDFNFIDQTIALQYEKENKLMKLISIFFGLAILISLLGLFGLIKFTTQFKTKEIGVRKVNGAKNIQIVEMLDTDVLKWIIVAFIIACPIAWYAMNTWLQNFAYKTEISWWIFALAGTIALVIALLTVSLQSWRAASRNPVEALRYE